jgi:hypothetical protein
MQMTSHNLTQNLASLSTADAHHLFRLCHDNAALLSKIIPGVPLLEYIITGNTTLLMDHAIIQQYEAWKSNNT